MVQVWYSYFNGKKQRVDKPSVFLFVLTRIRFLKSTGRSRRMDFKCNTQHLDSFGWSALPLHFPLLLQSLSMLRDTFPRYISIPPLVASVGTVHFRAGISKNKYSSPCRFRTAHKEGPSAFNLWCHTSGSTARLMRRGVAYWSREAALSRHTSTALSMAAAFASASAPGI